MNVFLGFWDGWNMVFREQQQWNVNVSAHVLCLTPNVCVCELTSVSVARLGCVCVCVCVVLWVRCRVVCMVPCSDDVMWLPLPPKSFDLIGLPAAKICFLRLRVLLYIFL